MPKKHSIRRYIVPILIIVISILFLIIMFKSKPEPIQTNAEERAWEVQSSIIKLDSHQPVLALYGRVVTSMDIQLTASIEADVVKRHVNLGDSVKTGQLLLSLDKSRLEQNQIQRKAELTEANMLIKSEKQQFETDTTLLSHEKSLLKIANTALKRAKTLEKSLMASNSQLDDAKRAVIQQKLSITRLESSLANHPARLTQLKAKKQQAQSRLALAEDDLKDTLITSPINGVITQISVDNAEHVRKGTALFSISDTQNIEIQSLVPQSQFISLQNTLKQTGEVKAIIQTDDFSLPATLNRLPPNINKGQAGSFAFFKLNKPDNSLLIGQTVTIHASLNTQENSIALPHDAIYGTDSIFLIEEERLKRVKVTWLGETVLNDKKSILIHSKTLKNGDEVLTSKFANAMHGLKVKAQGTKLEK